MRDVARSGAVLTGSLQSAITRRGMVRRLLVAPIAHRARLCSSGSSIICGGCGSNTRHHVSCLSHRLFDTPVHLDTSPLRLSHRSSSSSSSNAHDVWPQSLAWAATEVHSLAQGSSVGPRRRSRSQRWRYTAVVRRWGAVSPCLRRQQRELTQTVSCDVTSVVMSGAPRLPEERYRAHVAGDGEDGREEAAAADAIEGQGSSDRGDAATEDPLLAYLQQHQEDGAVMLAMWSSLYRCCLYASEVTEALALRVRYVFHLLLRHRAVAAAVRLYERLQQIGVELRQSDLLLLLTSLPYEHSAARGTAQATLRRAQDWIDEETAEQKSRANLAQRTAAQREAEAVTRARHAALQAKTDVAATTVPPAGTSTHLSPVGVVESAVGRHPAWVRNWVLYELSMGNLDLDGDEAEDKEDTSSISRYAALSRNEVKSVCDDLLCQLPEDAPGLAAEVRDSAALDTATEARQQRVLVAMLEHLYVLQQHASAGQTGHAHQATARARHAGGSRQRRCAMHKEALPRRGHALRPARDLCRRDRICREALHLVHLYVQERDRGGTARVATAAARSERVVSEAVTNVVHDLVRASAMNTTAAASLLGVLYARVMQHEAHAFAFRDLVLFFRRCAEARPWAASVKVEQLVGEELLPLVSEDSAAGLAVQALWFSHLCLVKASGAELFFVQLQHVQRLWAMPALQQGDFATLVQHAVAKARLATSHLLVEVRRWGRARRDEALLAASLRSGAYVPALTDGAAEKDETRAVTDQPAVVDAVAPRLSQSPAASTSEGRWWGRPGPDALLPPGLIDAFVVCTEAVLDALAAAAALSVRHGTSADTVTVAALHSLLESAVLGPFGLWGVFGAVYLVQDNDANSERAVRRAPERAWLAMTLARFVVRALQLLCRWAGEPDAGRPRADDTGFSASQTRRLLEVASAALRAALPLAATTCAARGDFEVAAEKLAVEVALLCKPLLTFLRLYDSADERAVFGAVQPDVMTTVGLYGRLLMLVDDVTRASRACDRTDGANGEATCVQSSLSPRPWRPVFARLTLRGRRAMRFCFDPSHSLGGHVRRQLGQRELRKLDATLRRRQRRGGGVDSDVVLALPGASDEAASVLDQALSMRAELYAAMLTSQRAGQGVQSETRCNEDLDAVARRLALRCTWRESCVLMQLLARDLRPARRSLSVQFFVDAIAAMRRGLPPPHGLAPVHRRLWLDAIGVYWHAVDHTAPALRDARGGMAVRAEGRPGGSARPGGAHERAVLAACLLSLSELSNAVGRRDVGRQWRRAWAAMYTSAERRELAWAERNIAVLAALRDRGALQACAALYARAASQASLVRCDAVARLLCDVSVRHADWRQAIDTLQVSFGSAEHHGQRATHYSAPVLHAMLVLLSRSPTNLSNTALRLRALQQDAWDAGAALTLLRMLLRARRWRLALQQVQDALRLPDMQHVQAVLQEGGDTTATNTVTGQDTVLCAVRTHLRPDNKEAGEHGAALTPATLQYASLLVCGLRACAIGSQGDTAAVLYDAFKTILHRYCSDGNRGDADDCRTHSHGSVTSPTDNIDALLATPLTPVLRREDGGRGDDMTQQLRRQLQEHATRARAFFFRAMTKKLK